MQDGGMVVTGGVERGGFIQIKFNASHMLDIRKSQPHPPRFSGIFKVRFVGSKQRKKGSKLERMFRIGCKVVVNRESMQSTVVSGSCGASKWRFAEILGFMQSSMVRHGCDWSCGARMDAGEVVAISASCNASNFLCSYFYNLVESSPLFTIQGLVTGRVEQAREGRSKLENVVGLGLVQCGVRLLLAVWSEVVSYKVVTGSCGASKQVEGCCDFLV